METSLESKAFKFLERLRESGVTNMLGATPYLEDAFDLEPRHARNLLLKWIDNLNKQEETWKL